MTCNISGKSSKCGKIILIIFNKFTSSFFLDSTIYVFKNLQTIEFFDLEFDIIFNSLKLCKKSLYCKLSFLLIVEMIILYAPYCNKILAFLIGSVVYAHISNAYLLL